jgi:SAM-dependent methyltransferase
MMSGVLRQRANELASRIAPLLPPSGRMLDIGCGTGHNAVALRSRLPNLCVHECDVVDMKIVGPPPVLFDHKLPFADGTFDAATLLFVLQYPADPLALLREARRVAAGRVIVLQSTHRGRVARGMLAARGFIQGRGAFAVARRVGVVNGCSRALRPRRMFDPDALEHEFAAAGLRIVRREPHAWPMTGLSRDLYLLERA